MWFYPEVRDEAGPSLALPPKMIQSPVRIPKHWAYNKDSVLGYGEFEDLI